MESQTVSLLWMQIEGHIAGTFLNKENLLNFVQPS